MSNVNDYGWNLEGHTIEGLYIGDYVVQGKVENSRVKYGGKVQHQLIFEAPVMIGRHYREGVVLDHEQVIRVMK